MFDPFKQAKLMNAYKGFTEFTPPEEKDMSLDELKRLAGIPKYYDLNGDRLDNNYEISGAQKAQYMRDNNIRPGDPEWFKVMFAKPHLTGEDPFSKK